MTDHALYAVCFSHIGKRLTHEDNFLIKNNYLTSDMQRRMSDRHCCFFCGKSSSRVALYAVSDGMGGHNAGEIASQVCVEMLAAAQKKIQQYNSIEDVVACLQSVIEAINKKVCAMSNENSEMIGMGATLVLFVACGDKYAVLNVGDSRAYYLYNQQIAQITKDNTEGQRMLDLGLLTRKELLSFPARKNLNRYIGLYQSGYTLRADEYYLIADEGFVILCSDGISDSVSNERILEIFNLEKTAEDAGKRLIDEAVASQYSDNATIMIIKLRR